MIRNVLIAAYIITVLAISAVARANTQISEVSNLNCVR